MPVTLRHKKELSFALIILILGSFVGLLLANQFWLRWIEVTPIYWLGVFAGSIALIFFLSLLLYVGPVLSRARHAFIVTFHKIPWSFLALVISLSIFLLYRRPAQASSVAGELPGSTVIMLAGLLVPVFLTVAILSWKSFGIEDLGVSPLFFLAGLFFLLTGLSLVGLFSLLAGFTIVVYLSLSR